MEREEKVVVSQVFKDWRLDKPKARRSHKDDASLIILIGFIKRENMDGDYKLTNLDLKYDQMWGKKKDSPIQREDKTRP